MSFGRLADGAVQTPVMPLEGRSILSRICRVLYAVVPDLIFVPAACLLVYLRWGMLTANGMTWAWNGGADGGLLVRNAMPRYEWVDAQNRMVKRPGYPIWLQLCHVLDLSPVTANLLAWTIAALLAMIALRWATRKRLPAYLLFVLILWLPSGFTSSVGYQVYRNALLAPTVVILASLLALNALTARLDTRAAWAARIPVAVGLGLVMAFSWVLKEDAVWLLPLTAAAIVVAVISALRQPVKWWLRILSVLLVLAPIPAAVTCVNLTLDSHERHFGVRLLETRTEGELGDLWRNIMSIDSPDRSMQVWTSSDQIHKAFSVSPTLRSIDGLETALTTPGGYRNQPGDDNEGSYQGELRGEYLQWQLRYAIEQVRGGWPGETWIQDTFGKANDEIEQAFSDGTLTRAKGVSIMASIPAYTWDQIASLKPRIISSLGWLMDPTDVSPLPAGGAVEITNPFQREGVEWLRLDVSGRPTTFIDHDTSIRIIQDVQKAWTVIAWTGIIVLAAGPIVMIIRRRKKGILWWIFAVGFGVYGVAYLLAETWYASYLSDAQFGGSVGYNALPCVQPLYATAVCTALAALLTACEKRRAETVSDESIQSFEPSMKPDADPASAHKADGSHTAVGAVRKPSRRSTSTDGRRSPWRLSSKPGRHRGTGVKEEGAGL